MRRWGSPHPAAPKEIVCLDLRFGQRGLVVRQDGVIPGDEIDLAPRFAMGALGTDWDAAQAAAGRRPNLTEESLGRSGQSSSRRKPIFIPTWKCSIPPSAA